MKIYITKYALTAGIYEAEEIERDKEDTTLRMVTVDWKDAPNGRQYFFDSDWHVDIMQAMAKVANMVASKRKSLEKKWKALDNIARDLAGAGHPSKWKTLKLKVVEGDERNKARLGRNAKKS